MTSILSYQFHLPSLLRNYSEQLRQLNEQFRALHVLGQKPCFDIIIKRRELRKEFNHVQQSYNIWRKDRFRGPNYV